MANRKRTLTIDFDGVVNMYTSGWKGADVISDPPVPGAMAFLQEAVTKFHVNIFSTRNHQVGAIEAMREYIRRHLVEYLGNTEEADSVVGKLEFPVLKPPSHMMIDDRAFTFEGVWPSMEFIENFKPWNKR